MSYFTGWEVSIVVLLAAFVAFIAGLAMGCYEIRNQAIAVGVAHYEADNRGDITFVWNTPEGGAE